MLRLDKARGNAIDEPLVDELTAAARELGADAAVRGVLLASAHPKLFCPGLDLVSLDRARPRRPCSASCSCSRRWCGRSTACPSRWWPAVNGHAVAGGCILALTADHRVLRRGGAQIGLNEVRVGVPLPWPWPCCCAPRCRPDALARVALLGRNFADEEALRGRARGRARRRRGLRGPLPAAARGVRREGRLRPRHHQGRPARRRSSRAMQAARGARAWASWLDGWFSGTAHRGCARISASSQREASAMAGRQDAARGQARPARASSGRVHGSNADSRAPCTSHAAMAAPTRARGWRRPRSPRAVSQFRPRKVPKPHQDRVPDGGGERRRQQRAQRATCRPRPRTA